jgi:putative Mn2+ efflux pump MntP
VEKIYQISIVGVFLGAFVSTNIWDGYAAAIVFLISGVVLVSTIYLKARGEAENDAQAHSYDQRMEQLAARVVSLEELANRNSMKGLTGR